MAGSREWSGRFASRVAPLVVAAFALLWLAAPALVAAQEGDATLEGDFTVTIVNDDVPTDLPNGSTLVGRWRVSFNADGTFVVERLDVGVLVSGTFTVDGNRVTLTDESGLLACANAAARIGDQGDVAAGTYRWSLDDGNLSLTPVDDGCAGRRLLLGTREFTQFVACLTGEDPAAAAEPAAGTPSAVDIRQPDARGPETGPGEGDEPGQQSPQEIEAAIDALLSQLTACWATGDPSRFLPLLSDGFRAELLGPTNDRTDMLRGLAASMGVPLSFERAGDIDVVDDTRVTAVVRTTTGDEDDFSRFRFVLEDGAWRWDGFA